MKFLYLGDIMGDLGIRSLRVYLKTTIEDHKIDFVLAQGENVDNGKGISVQQYLELKKLGVDFFTGGNWSLFNPEIYPYLNDPKEPIIRPANYPKSYEGLGYKYLKTTRGQVLVISVLGRIVGRDLKVNFKNPLKTVDDILAAEQNVPRIATIINFHGDYSSEKVIIGHYFNGRVTAVIGDHWHVPSNDARLLDAKTAYISDVGMNGSLNSSLGVKLDIAIKRWLNDAKLKNELVKNDKLQFNGVVIDFSTKTGLAKSIKQIRIVS